ncbi:MAG: N-acetylmuramoyl-L-alanine amidase, partial [Edaphobacter sp.]
MGCVAVLCCTAMVQEVSAKTRTAVHRRVELSPWQQAMQGREALESIPPGSRTRTGYTKAMEGFKAIYHQSPGDTYAPAAVNAVAELLAEQGRDLHDTKSLKDAIGQYEFLRKEYPGSSLRVAALLAEAQIYQNDLHDATAAQEQYALLVRLYPKSGHAEEARAGLASLKGKDQRDQKDRDQGLRANKGETAAKSQNVMKSPAEDAVRVGGRALPAAERGGSKGSSAFAPMP